jgi:starch synthase
MRTPDAGSANGLGSVKAEAQRARGRTVRGTPKRAWMLSFESSDVAQLGGLGSAVAGLAKALAQELDVCVFMPSHGRHNDARLREKLGLKEVKGFVSQGGRIGADGNVYPYLIGMEEGHCGGVRYFLAKGLDRSTSRWLDDPRIYDGELTYQKASLFARAAQGYLHFILKGTPESRPDVVHANDWHSIPAAVALKQAFMERRISVPLVFTIHLLSDAGSPWHYISEDWCGIKDEQHCVSLNGSRRFVTYKEAWEDLSAGKFERFGAVEADFVASVSKTYLLSDVLPFLGLNVGEKTGFIYNSCDWDEEKIIQSVRKEHSQRMGGPTAPKPARSDFRRYLLTRALGETKTPVISESEVREVVDSLPGSKIRAFSDDGPLVLTTGRLDRQKGMDVLLRAVPEVLEVFPAAKFLFLLVPLLNKELIHSTIHEAGEHEKSVRVVLGRTAEIYKLAHISADAYAMPSRWEPFGISALEAMATGNPVVGTRVGGITETVLDILDHREEGTGRLVAAEDHRELARGIVCFLAMMEIEDDARRGVRQGRQNLLDAIAYDQVRELVTRDPTIGSTIRMNCRTRVQRQFSPENAAQMALRVYEIASRISSGRNAPI